MSWKLGEAEEKSKETHQSMDMWLWSGQDRVAKIRKEIEVQEGAASFTASLYTEDKPLKAVMWESP